jgi:hypothetical protein
MCSESMVLNGVVHNNNNKTLSCFEWSNTVLEKGAWELGLTELSKCALQPVLGIFPK